MPFAGCVLGLLLSSEYGNSVSKKIKLHSSFGENLESKIFSSVGDAFDTSEAETTCVNLFNYVILTISLNWQLNF
jgi:hypothetical protein